MSTPLVALESLPIDIISGIIIACGFVALIITLPRKKDVHDISGPISTKGCEALAIHKYKASDYTVLDNLLNPWWNWCASLLPKTLAPNVVTLIGWVFYYPVVFALVLYSTSILSEQDPLDIYYRPSLGLCPRTVYALGALAIFWYQTFDAMDGKQARALGVAGPLGQIMDHGCDAVSTILVATLSCFALRLAFPGYLTLSFFLLTSFYVPNWGEKYTHVLMTSVSKYLGVTEGQYMGAGVLLLPALFGEDFWLNPLQHYFGHQSFLLTLSSYTSSFWSFISRCFEPFLPQLSVFLNNTCVNYDLNNLPLGYVIFWFLFVSGIYMLFLCFTDVAKHIAKDTREEYFKLDTKLNIITPTSELNMIIFRRTIRAFCEVIPFFSTIFMVFMWYNYSLPNPDINKNWYGAFFYHPVLSIIAVSIVGVHLICQVIINSMSYSPNHLFQPLIFPMFMLQSFDIIPSFMQTPTPILPPELHYILWCSVIVTSFVVQIRYALSVVQQISNIFGIYILKLGPKTKTPPVDKIRQQMERRQA